VDDVWAQIHTSEASELPPIESMPLGSFLTRIGVRSIEEGAQLFPPSCFPPADGGGDGGGREQPQHQQHRQQPRSQGLPPLSLPMQREDQGQVRLAAELQGFPFKFFSLIIPPSRRTISAIERRASGLVFAAILLATWSPLRQADQFNMALSPHSFISSPHDALHHNA